MPGEAVAEETRQIVEQRMDDCLKPDEAAFVFLGSLRRKGAEALVLPEDVVPAAPWMSDPQPSLARHTNQLSVAEQRAEDHLELHGVWRDAVEGDARMLDHIDEFDRRLRPPRFRGVTSRIGGGSP